MLFYNVKRSFFAMKAEAEAYRKVEGLKADALVIIELKDRNDACALLNALCGHEQATVAALSHLPEPVTTPEVIQRAQIDPALDVPDYVPRFLLKDHKEYR